VELCLYSPNIFMVWCLVKHRDNFMGVTCIIVQVGGYNTFKENSMSLGIPG
jgi:hypothetical protein